jgi:hypothetical protein
MKESDVNIDELIKQALSEEESEHLERLSKEQNVFEELLASFQGSRKWLSVYVTVVIFIFFGISIYSLVQFLSVETTREMLLWGAAMGGSLLIVTMLKVWYWMQMDRNAIIRELKRLELQIATLKKKK